ncbi:pyridoxal phosphate-dependent decarboxylase family protein [Bosea sp. (in: a-proteobacteria)]|jgi:glutamate/tyrosine decarboxylase-like PLP-dependent enzyme|uniref:pyridoxal phosphate-dependent decarboxylase family protein n=1 Tax=Bosea sp. (in: a-proteobacteria) TaxID=1871050 RepID=UPI003F7249EA
MSNPHFDPAALFQDAAARATAFRRGLSGRLQRPEQGYAAMLARLAGPTPESGTAAERVIAELASDMEPGLHAMAGARFFGWVIGASHPVGVAADWLTSAWGQNCGNHQAAPAGAAVEAVTAAWLLDLLALPEEASVGFVTGATVANLVCLAAARGEVLRRAGWDVEANGLFGAPEITVLIGNDAHTTVFSALQLLGLGHDRVRRIATDSEGRVRPEALAQAIEASPEPVIVALQAGQINTGAFDPFREAIAIARRKAAWVHVDGAFGLWARASRDRAHLATGAEGADSWATDGHKWLQTPYDCGFAIIRDSHAHRRAMTALASYLPEVAEGERDPSHFVPELSRRARGFATFAMIRHLGRSGIAGMVERHCRLACQMADLLRAEPGIAIVNAVDLNQVVVRFGADRPPEEGDRLTLAVIARVQADGVCFAGGAKWRDRWIMRLSVISWPTEAEDVAQSAEAIIAAWRICRVG